MEIKRYQSKVWIMLLLILTFSNAAQATIPTPGFPLIDYNASGVTTFNPGTDLFSVDAEPVNITFTSGSAPAFIFAPRDMNINIQVDGPGCTLIGGNPSGGPDLEVIGDIYDPVTFALLYSGVLLTGDIASFSFAGATPTVSGFDFRFNNAAGALLSDPNWPAGSDIGVILSSEQEGPTPNPPFVDCDTGFDGLAKGTIGPIEPEVTEVCDLYLEKTAVPDVLGPFSYSDNHDDGDDSDSDSDSGNDYDLSGDTDDSDFEPNDSDSGHTGPSCGCKDRVKYLTMRYNLAAPNLVEVKRKKGKNNWVTLFGPQMLQPGEEFSFNVRGRKIDFLINETSVEMLKTTCRNPIGAGQQIGDGALVVVSGTSKFKDGTPLCPAPGTSCSVDHQVTYTYDLTNNGTVVNDVVIFDDQIGVIGSVIPELGAGESVSLQETVCIFEDTINTADATGTQGANACESNEAQETVIVLPPQCPPGDDTDSDSGHDGNNNDDSDDSDSDSGPSDCDRDEPQSCFGDGYDSDSDSGRDSNRNDDSDDSDSDSDSDPDCDYDD